MFDTIFNLALIVIGFGILIFIHELGHFAAAKWAGIRTEAFAVGMGPVMASWRKGIGIRFGSTARVVEDRVNEYYKTHGNGADESTSDDQQRKLIYEAMDALGIGATEYSLRWLPIGGFVKMLGQEDANPQATSDLRGSYQNTPIGKRMIVVSAGVIANLILAVGLFMWAFMVGVPMDAPVVGGVEPDSPAALAVADEADELGVTEIGLQPGDRVVSINENTTETFNDLAVAAAMGKLNDPLDMLISRSIGGVDQDLTFHIQPEPSKLSGLLSLGILRASSTRLLEAFPGGLIARALDETGLAGQGVEKGMTLRRAGGAGGAGGGGGEPILTMQQFAQIVNRFDGEEVPTEWIHVDDEGNPYGEAVSARVPVREELQFVTAEYDGDRIMERALIGFSPLTRISFIEKDSVNRDALRNGDVFLSIGAIDAPRRNEFRTFVADSKGKTLTAVIVRDGERKTIEVEVSRKGRIGIMIEDADDLLMIARPIVEYTLPREPDQSLKHKPSPLAGKDIWSLSTILAVDGTEVGDWGELRAALLDATQDAFENEDEGSVSIELALDASQESPDTPETPETIDVSLTVSAEEVTELHALGWTTQLDPAFFAPLETILTAGGNPITAIGMGFEGTYKFVINTYLTIDRLFRGTIGVEQLRGPVGIVHLGTQIADRGFMFLIFFLAMISVNLAVINFLPLPIVDGGLFLFLIYEKLKGRPPSVTFQNWATIAGLLMIVTLFLVVTYNDVSRLIFG